MTPSKHWRLQPPMSSFSILVPLLLLFVTGCTRCDALFPPRPRPRRRSPGAPSNRGRRRAATEGANGTESRGSSAKDLLICSVSGGLDLTRFRSSNARAVLAGALDDAEFLREYLSESMTNDGIRGGLSNLDDLAATLDWKRRNDFAAANNWSGWTNLTANDTTVSAGLGWTDDRPDRRVERYVESVGVPRVGTKETDMAFLDTASNVLPWMIDRRSKEDRWYVEHQNGRSEGPTKEPLPFDTLYDSAWILSWGGAFLQYPPLSATEGDFGFDTLADLLSIFEGTSLWDLVGVLAPPGWPFSHKVMENSSIKDVVMGTPTYSLKNNNFPVLDAIAPVYYTGEWKGYSYNDTLIGAVGIEVQTEAIAPIFDDLEDRLCNGSFALLANADTFGVIGISQSVTEKLYPENTTASDTVEQGLLDGLVSANWTVLHNAVQVTPRGGRDYIIMNITATGETQPREYYAMFDRWNSVSDYVMLVFAPVEGVSKAIEPVLSSPVVYLEVPRGENANVVSTLTNNGTLGVVVSIPELQGMPDWIAIVGSDLWKTGIVLPPGDTVRIEFEVKTKARAAGNYSKTLAIMVADDDYRDCTYSSPIVLTVSVRATNETNFNYLGSFRIFGYFLFAVVTITAIGFASWVWFFRKSRVVRASQPPFLLMIIGGCFIMGCAIIPLSIDDEVASAQGCSIACMANVWLETTGLVTTFSALAAKTWRINRIFHTANFKKVTVTTRDVIMPLAVMLFLNTVILICWTIVAPLVWTRVKIDEWSSYGVCASGDWRTILFSSLIAATNLAALIFACVQAYRARKISVEYSESKWIAISLGGLLQVYVLAIPLQFLVAENPTAMFFVQSLFAFFQAMIVLLLIFIPKVVYMRKQKKKRAKKEADALARADTNATGGIDMTHGTEPDTTHRTKPEDLQETMSPGVRILNIRNTMKEAVWGSTIADCTEKKLEKALDENDVLKALLHQHGINYEGELLDVASNTEDEKKGETERFSNGKATSSNPSWTNTNDLEGKEDATAAEEGVERPQAIDDRSGSECDEKEAARGSNRLGELVEKDII